MAWQCNHCSLYNYIESLKCIACFQINKDALCANCNKKQASIECNKCNQTYYCSEQCKAIHYKSKHSTECNILSVEQNILNQNSSTQPKLDYNSFALSDNSLIIPSDRTISLSSNKQHTFNYVIISKNGTLQINQDEKDKAPCKLIITIKKYLILYQRAKITVNGCGYFGGIPDQSFNDKGGYPGESINGKGTIRQQTANDGGGGFGKDNGGGGGYGSKGNDAGYYDYAHDPQLFGKGGECYGEETLNILHYGSGGGSGGDAVGGRGGGILVLNVGKSIIMYSYSEINCEGGTGGYSYGGGGGGSGGSLKIMCNKLIMAKVDKKRPAVITARGGDGRDGDEAEGDGGTGGDGRLAIYIQNQRNRNYIISKNRYDSGPYWIWEYSITPKAYISFSFDEQMLICGYLRTYGLFLKDLIELITVFYKYKTYIPP
eukprot:158151_1